MSPENASVRSRAKDTCMKYHRKLTDSEYKMTCIEVHELRESDRIYRIREIADTEIPRIHDNH